LKFVLGIFEISSEDNDKPAYEELGLGGCVGLPSWRRKCSSISTMKDQPECSLGWGSLGWRKFLFSILFTPVSRASFEESCA
jgi:hypothetical protein